LKFEINPRGTFEMKSLPDEILIGQPNIPHPKTPKPHPYFRSPLQLTDSSGARPRARAAVPQAFAGRALLASPLQYQKPQFDKEL
jgi:hypothetical protein